MTGNILCLMAELCFATYCVVFKDLIGRYSSVTLWKWMFTYGGDPAVFPSRTTASHR